MVEPSVRNSEARVLRRQGCSNPGFGRAGARFDHLRFWRFKQMGPSVARLAQRDRARGMGFVHPLHANNGRVRTTMDRLMRDGAKMGRGCATPGGDGASEKDVFPDSLTTAPKPPGAPCPPDPDPDCSRASALKPMSRSGHVGSRCGSRDMPKRPRKGGAGSEPPRRARPDRAAIRGVKGRGPCAVPARLTGVRFTDMHGYSSPLWHAFIPHGNGWRRGRVGAKPARRRA